MFKRLLRSALATAAGYAISTWLATPTGLAATPLLAMIGKGLREKYKTDPPWWVKYFPV
jgi:hypothetical protein